MKSFLEWYLGIPPAQPGQGTQWTWLHQTPWPAGLPLWMVVVLSVAAVLYTVWIYRRDGRTVSTAGRIVLTGLRLSVVVCVLLILTELTLVVDRTGLPFVAVLIDDSASMSLDDQYTDPLDKAAAERLKAAVQTDRATRLSLAQGLLTQDNGDFLRRLHDRHQVRVYRFSDSAAPLGGLETDAAGSMEALITSIRELAPAGQETRPAQAVRKVLNDFRGSLPSAIIVLSDGITSTADADRLTSVAETAARRLVPLYTVGIGSEEAMHDLHLYDTLVDEVAFVNDPITFTARLKSFGFKGKSVKLILRDKKQRAPLVTRQVTAADDGQTLPVEITWIPDAPGDYEFILEATPQPTETDQTNNSETRQVSVREGRIRVLLIDSVPRWEFRELKVLLERENTVELHTVLQDADLQFADQDSTAQPLRGRFPVSREQLFSYDVVVFGDVDPRYLSPTVIENLQVFVSEAGGGLIMVAGPKFNPVAYRDTGLATLLPVDATTVELPPADEVIKQPFQPKLTLEGQKSTPIFRFDESEQAGLAAWQNLPGLYWLAAAPDIKPGATVFVEHPTRIGQGRNLPVIVMQRYGAGKVLFHATDETFQWRRRIGDRYYGRYWVQAIRYLSRARLLGQAKSAELQTDRLVYNRGEPVTIRLRFFNEEQIPTGDEPVNVVVERRGGSRVNVRLKAVTQAPNAFEGQLRNAVEGSWHAWVSAPDFKDAPPSSDFRVEAPERELRIRGLDRKELTEAARTTRGRSYHLHEALSLPDDVPRGRPVPVRSEEPIRIWNRWEVLGLFVLLLTIEWLLRKRLRMV